jgi:hypothetical protein
MARKTETKRNLFAELMTGIDEMRAPTLTTLEWAHQPEKLNLSEAALMKIQETASASREPSARLRAAVTRHRR